MGGPPHGLHTYGTKENEGNESAQLVFTSDDDNTETDEDANESSSDYTWGSTSYMPEPQWGKQNRQSKLGQWHEGAQEQLNRAEELRRWEETNIKT